MTRICFRLASFLSGAIFSIQSRGCSGGQGRHWGQSSCRPFRHLQVYSQSHICVFPAKCNQLWVRLPGICRRRYYFTSCFRVLSTVWLDVSWSTKLSILSSLSLSRKLGSGMNLLFVIFIYAAHKLEHEYGSAGKLTKFQLRRGMLLPYRLHDGEEQAIWREKDRRGGFDWFVSLISRILF